MAGQGQQEGAPLMASPRSWPFDDDPDELLAGTHADRPVVAIGVRASVGRPGGSAQAAWRRVRAAEWAAWTRTLPWRVTAILVVGAVGGVLGSQLAPSWGWSWADWPPWRPAGGCGSSPARTPSRGGEARRGSSAPPDCSATWSDTGGRSCTTWPSPGSPAATRSPHAAFRTLPAVLGPERVAALADQARVRFHAAA
jgi:hypothetical protein